MMVVCRCSFSVAHSQKCLVYDNASAAFCRLGISLEKPSSRNLFGKAKPKLLGKDLGMM